MVSGLASTLKNANSGLSAMQRPAADMDGVVAPSSSRLFFCAISILLLVCGTPAIAASLFQTETHLPQADHWQVDADALCQVSDATQAYFAKGVAYDPDVLHAGKVFNRTVTIERVKETLAFICQIAEEDTRLKQPSRLNQPEFIQQQFEILRWQPDDDVVRQAAKQKSLLRKLPQGEVLITRYYVHKAMAKKNKSADTPYALYGVPYDEQALTIEQAEQQRDTLTRYRVTKQQALNGALDALAPPLVWIARDDLEAALMQGTLVTQQQDEEHVFNVHRNNGIRYDFAVRPYEQARYWYFKAVPHILGYGKDAHFKIPILPEVTVAGDLQQLGLGKLMLMRRNEAGEPVYRMALLADTGGAFVDNLHQLDWLSGAYQGKTAYRQANRHIADYAQIWMLLKK